MRPRTGFSLMETLLVVAIMMGLTALLYPLVNAADDTGHIIAAAATARQVRQQIALHAAIRDGPTSPEGYPAAIDPKWFAGHRLPTDPWTLNPIAVQVVAGPDTVIAPNQLTFELGGNNTAVGK